MCCQQHPTHFLSIRGTPTARQRIEHWEERLIEQLGRHDIPLESQAIAFRSLMELRGCTARDVGEFFAVEPRVIVAGLSLLEKPTPSVGQAQPPLARGRKSRTKAA